MTLGGILHETNNWLALLPGSADFVDPEIGMVVLAALRNRIGFGCLHIILNNLVEKYQEDLSNERIKGILDHTARLYDVLQDIIRYDFNPIEM